MFAIYIYKIYFNCFYVLYLLMSICLLTIFKKMMLPGINIKTHTRRQSVKTRYVF